MDTGDRAGRTDAAHRARLAGAAHREIVRERDGADVFVLFVHGFMGCPRQFEPWMAMCEAKGYSAAAILLPGHGGDGRAFARCALPDWEACVGAAVERVRGRYRVVVGVGHSMGGLLLLNASVGPGRPLDALFLIAPPIRINLRPWSIRARLSMATSRRRPEMRDHYLSVYGVGATPLYVYPGWARPFASLKRLIEKAKRNLDKVDVPVYLIHSSRDEAVSLKSADALDRGLRRAPHERLLLEGSWHAYYTDEETRLVGEKLIAFIGRVE